MDGHVAAGDEAQRARLKALLSSYYGGGSDASASGSGAAAGNSGRPGTNPTHPNQRGHPDHNAAPPPPSMDSPAFNADQHIAQVIPLPGFEDGAGHEGLLGLWGAHPDQLVSLITPDFMVFLRHVPFYQTCHNNS